MQDTQIHRMQWAGLDIEVRYRSNWSNVYARTYGYSLAHLEIDAKGHPLPMTTTGYRSHFDRADFIEAAGGPVQAVREWLDAAAESPEWQAMKAAQRQLSFL